MPQEETFQARRQVKIPMPDRLKSLLVDDWENVTKNLQLVQLPSSKPAGVILDEYFEAQKSHRRNNTEVDILEEVIQGLKEYFNKSVGRLLLYRFEREQFLQILLGMEQPTSNLVGRALTDIYGGEHLLRLLGTLLFFTECSGANECQSQCPSSSRRPTWTPSLSAAYGRR
jgi:mortality factor 4-like protein 1